ncbi:hypothetical protein J4Q44_G00153660 [Coregonus suidteri]|uniref:Uncharacterized protein n=1 Tax=Coregonus suidteri TaxID=861788 RepID=A0AAN8LL08_9TELE
MLSEKEICLPTTTCNLPEQHGPKETDRTTDHRKEDQESQSNQPLAEYSDIQYTLYHNLELSSTLRLEQRPAIKQISSSVKDQKNINKIVLGNSSQQGTSPLPSQEDTPFLLYHQVYLYTYLLTPYCGLGLCKTWSGYIL